MNAFNHSTEMTLAQISKKYPDKILRINGEFADACWLRTDWSCCPVSHGIYRRILSKRKNLSEDIIGTKGLFDHKDRNNWNNTIENLRPCSYAQNACNKKRKLGVSGFYGVYPYKDGRWSARISFENVEHYLGLFETKEQAARAYNNKALELHKEFAILNKI